MKSPATGSFEWIKRINTSRILEVLRESGSVSRADIARRTGLTPATVSNITAELIGLGLLEETERGKSSGGRKPVLLSIRAKACFFVGIHINSEVLEVAITDLEDEILWQEIKPLGKGARAEDVLGQAVARIHTAVSRIKDGGVAGIGVCVHGLVKTDEGVLVYAPNLGWENVKIGKALFQEFGLPVVVQNDVHAMAIAESWCGLARNVRDYVYFYGGFGIGGAIVIDGDLYRGDGGFAGEFGHNTVSPDGPLCTCGNRGCLQAVASEATVLARFLVRKNDPKYSEFTYPDVLAEAKRGDPVAVDEILKSVQYIGIEVGNIINSLSPSLIVLNGRFTSLGEPAMEVIEQEVRRRGLKYSQDTARIRFSRLGDRAQIYGAAAIMIREMFADPQKFLRG